MNVISYSKSAIINDTHLHNYDGLLRCALKNLNLLEDAEPYFRGKVNYDQWRKIEVAKRICKQLKKDLIWTGIKIDMSILLKSFRYSEYEGDEMVDSSEALGFNNSLQKDHLKQQILLLHNLINEHIK